MTIRATCAQGSAMLETDDDNNGCTLEWGLAKIVPARPSDANAIE